MIKINLENPKRETNFQDIYNEDYGKSGNHGTSRDLSREINNDDLRGRIIKSDQRTTEGRENKNPHIKNNTRYIQGRP